MQTSMSIKSACFPIREKHADGVPIFTGSALFIWESAPKFMLRTCGLLSGKKNLPLQNVTLKLFQDNVQSHVPTSTAVNN
jgi:hypothetical protein